MATIATNASVLAVPAAPVAPAPADGGGVHAAGNKFNGSSRYSRVEFSKFSGEDLKGWVYRCEQFFDYDNTYEEQKVRVVSINLEGRALHWHQSMMKSRV